MLSICLALSLGFNLWNLWPGSSAPTDLLAASPGSPLHRGLPLSHEDPFLSLKALMSSLHGAYVHPSLGFQISRSGGASAVAVAGVARRETMLRLPASTIISQCGISSAWLSRRLKDLVTTHGQDMQPYALALYLLHDRHALSSPHRAYHEYLDTVDLSGLPFYWSQTQLASASGLVRQGTEIMRKHTEQAFALAQASAREGNTQEEYGLFKRYVAIVGTRSFSVPRRVTACEPFTSMTDPVHVLIPGADLINHCNNGSAFNDRVLGFEVEAKAALIQGDGYGLGDEICFNYTGSVGSCQDSHWLSYGYLDESLRKECSADDKTYVGWGSWAKGRFKTKQQTGNRNGKYQ